jgi:hypothetical protein
LPVHRARLDDRAAVRASLDDLDQWLHSREGAAAREGDQGTGLSDTASASARSSGADGGAQRRIRWPVAGLGLVIIAAGVGGVLWWKGSSVGQRTAHGIATPGAAAQTVPVSHERFWLDVTVGGEEPYVVQVLDGGLVTIQRPAAAKIGLGPVRRGNRLALFVFALQRATPDAPESGRQTDRLDLTADVPVALKVDP